MIRRSLMLIGVLAEGETPSADQLADGISTLNEMLGEWSNDNLLIPTTVREEFSLVAAQATRTMGPTGNYATTRPLEIESAMLENQSSAPTTESEVEIVTSEQWAAIPQKDNTSELPQKVWIQWNTPNITLNFYPVPTTAHKIVLYSQKLLLSVTSGNTDIALPPGYDKAIRYNLAIDLAPDYGKSVSAEIASGAASSKAGVKRKNIKTNYLTMDAGLTAHAGFNIFTGV